MNKTALSLLPLVFALSACTLGPDFEPPEAPGVSSYSAPNDAALPSDQQLKFGKQVEGDWWAQFRSAKLNALISRAIENNQSIAAAKARVAQAEEGVNAAGGALLPQVSLDAVAGRQKYGKSLFGPLDISVPPFTYYTVGPAVSFPLDLFGGKRRTLEEKKAYKEYQGYQLEAAYLSLSANVTMEALTIAAARDQIAVLREIIANDKRNVDLVRTALNVGSATRTQLLSVQSQMATDRTELPELRQQESTARHALAVLVGELPANWAPSSLGLADFSLPGEIPAAMPSQLVHRRPDIEAAEAQLHVASAEIGVTTANLYPQIDLTGTLTQQALTPASLFYGVSNAWAIAANLTQPLFDGGQLSAEKRAAVDGYQVSLADYKQTVLNAFGDVADRLQALANDADRLVAQKAATETASKSLNLARRSFKVGNSGILEVIDAERQLAKARLGLSRAQAARLMDTASLYLALGGTPVGHSPTVTADARISSQ